MTAREGVEALTDALADAFRDGTWSLRTAATRLLASPWLAAHDEGVRAAERERLAAVWEEVDGPDRVRRPPFRPFHRTPTIDLDEE